jgi:hypothetical protein
MRAALLGLPTSAAYLFPARQLRGRRVVPHLRRLLAALGDEGDPWTRLARLLEPSAIFDGQSPLDLLEAGRVEDALTALRYGP